MFKAQRKKTEWTNTALKQRTSDKKTISHFGIRHFISSPKSFQNQRKKKWINKRDHDIVYDLWLINIVISEYMNIQINKYSYVLYVSHNVIAFDKFIIVVKQNMIDLRAIAKWKLIYSWMNRRKKESHIKKLFTWSMKYLFCAIWICSPYLARAQYNVQKSKFLFTCQITVLNRNQKKRKEKVKQLAPILFTKILIIIILLVDNQQQWMTKLHVAGWNHINTKVWHVLFQIH